MPGTNRAERAVVGLERYRHPAQRREHVRTDLRRAAAFDRGAGGGVRGTGHRLLVPDPNDDVGLPRTDRCGDVIDGAVVAGDGPGRRMHHPACVYAPRQSADLAGACVPGEPRRLGSDTSVFRRCLPSGGRPDDVELRSMVEPDGASELYAHAGLYAPGKSGDLASACVPGESGGVGSDAGVYRKRLPSGGRPDDVELRCMVEPDGAGELYAYARVYAPGKSGDLASACVPGESRRLGSDAGVYRKRLPGGGRPDDVELRCMVEPDGAGELYACARVYASGQSPDLASACVSCEPRRLGSNAGVYRKRLPGGGRPDDVELRCMVEPDGAGELYGAAAGHVRHRDHMLARGMCFGPPQDDGGKLRDQLQLQRAHHLQRCQPDRHGQLQQRIVVVLLGHHDCVGRRQELHGVGVCRRPE